MADEMASTLGRIQVDVSHLEGAATWVDSLVRLLDQAKANVRMAEEAALTLGGKGGSAFGDYAVGGVPDLHRKTSGTQVAVERNLTDLAAGFHDTAHAVRGIANDYRTVEQRNKVDAAQVLDRIGRRK